MWDNWTPDSWLKLCDKCFFEGPLTTPNDDDNDKDDNDDDKHNCNDNIDNKYSCNAVFEPGKTYIVHIQMYNPLNWLL